MVYYAPLFNKSKENKKSPMDVLPLGVLKQIMPFVHSGYHISEWEVLAFETKCTLVKYSIGHTVELRCFNSGAIIECNQTNSC
jgi:hypothetical protein